MKKFLALLLAVLMTATLFSVPAFAAGEYFTDSDITSMEGIVSITAEATWILTYDANAADTSVTAAAAPSNTANADGNDAGYGKRAVVYKVKLPVVPVGKVIDFAEFRATSKYTDTIQREIPYAYKMPGQNWDMDTITIADAQKIIDGNNLGAGNNYIGSCTKEDSYVSGRNYRNKYSVSEYVTECIANNQEYMYIALTRPSSGVNVYPHTYNSSNYKPKLYYTLKDAPTLTAESSVPEADATGVYPIGDASVTFSNVIKSATATINGAEVPSSDISISGKTVTVAYDLPLSQATAFVINVTDIANQQLSHTVNFTVADRYKYYDDSDMEGVAYTFADESWVLTYDASASDTSVAAASSIVMTDNDVVGSSNKAAVYRVKLPEVPEGKAIATAEFRATSYYTDANPREMQYAYKMPGQDWNMNTITIADAQKIIDGNNLGAGNNYIGSCTMDASYVNGREYRNKYSVSEYVAECIANNQEYMYIALTRYSSMVRAFRHDRYANNAKLFYTLKDVPVVNGAKLVSADSEAEYADAADIVPTVGQSIKAICYLMNKTDADVALNVGVAQYEDGELVALSFVPYTLSAGTEGATVDFGASTVQKNVDEIKVFMWDANNNPVVISKAINMQ